jgi:superfamily I DNA and/or RNA helicase
MILVGDPMQLQPVLADPGHAVGAGVSQSFFAWIQQRGLPEHAAVFLHEQNRMHPAIGELVSGVFYSGRVQTGPLAPREALSTPLIEPAVAWLDTHDLPGSLEQRQVGQTSLRNEAEARLVAAVVEHLVSATPSQATIAVISAYAEQRDLLRRLLRGREYPATRQLEVETVDAFEGREKDIIVLSLVRANPAGQVGFLREEPRLNVAVSRARRLLVIVGDTRTLRGDVFDRLLEAVRRLGSVIPASAVSPPVP